MDFACACVPSRRTRATLTISNALACACLASCQTRATLAMPSGVAEAKKNLRNCRGVRMCVFTVPPDVCHARNPELRGGSKKKRASVKHANRRPTQLSKHIAKLRPVTAIKKSPSHMNSACSPSGPRPPTTQCWQDVLVQSTLN